MLDNIQRYFFMIQETLIRWLRSITNQNMKENRFKKESDNVFLYQQNLFINIEIEKIEQLVKSFYGSQLRFKMMKINFNQNKMLVYLHELLNSSQTIQQRQQIIQALLKFEFEILEDQFDTFTNSQYFLNEIEKEQSVFKQVLEFEMKNQENQKYYNKGSFQSQVYHLINSKFKIKQQKQGIILLKADYDDVLSKLYRVKSTFNLKTLINLFIPQITAKDEKLKLKVKKLMSKIDQEDENLSFENILGKLRQKFKELQLDYQNIIHE